MREIRFRAWDKIRKKMIDVHGIQFVLEKVLWQEYEPEKTNWYSDIENMELMQFTGLKDKNGKEIYEEDIVKWIGGSIEPIVWENFCAGFNLDESGARGVEVIGNIYENPELLKKGKPNANQ